MRISIVLCGVLALMAGSQSSTCLSQQSEATGQLIVLVKDTDGKSIPNATASVFRWTGKMEPLGLEAVTDGNGRGEISAFPAGDMFYMGIRAADFASTHQTIELNADEDRELTVILSRPEAVEKFAKEHGMTFPIVVDNSNGTLLDQYSKLGVYGFPSYILLGPDGKILANDCMADPDTLRLRSCKTEVIFHALQTGK